MNNEKKISLFVNYCEIAGITDYCNRELDFFKAGIDAALQAIEAEKIAKQNIRNNVYDIFKSVNKWANKNRLFFTGVYLDKDKQCKVYTDGKYCIVENAAIEETKIIDKDNNIIDSQYPNYKKVLDCKSDIKKDDVYQDCLKKELKTFDKLVNEKKDNDIFFVHFDIFANRKYKFILNQRIGKKLAYWVKCHENFNISFQCFDNANLSDFVEKIRLCDDKNNIFVAMCAPAGIYEALYNEDNEEAKKYTVANTIFMTNY